MPQSSPHSDNGTVPAWHAGFLRLLPLVERHAHAAFQHAPPHEHEEALAEAVAVAMIDYLDLLARGRLWAIDPDSLARAVVRHVADGQRACGRESSHDVLPPTVRHPREFRGKQFLKPCAANGQHGRVRLQDRPSGDGLLGTARAGNGEGPCIRIPFLGTVPLRESLQRSTRLYVGNLGPMVTDRDLCQLFELHGRVESVQRPRRRDTGLAKRFAFVDMSTVQEAARAIAELNGQDLDGRPLIVQKVRSTSNGNGDGLCAAEAEAVRLRNHRGPASNGNGDGPCASPHPAGGRLPQPRADTAWATVDDEFRAARRIQEKLLPTCAPVLPGFDISGMARPAVATGGDYFDYVSMRDGFVGIAVGDVCGHGFGPALVIASTRAFLRAFAQTHTDVAEVMALVNRVLTPDSLDERFVTLVLARLDPRTRSIVYSSAGHQTGYVLNASGAVRFSLPSTGPPLGLELDAEFPAAPPFTLDPGDLALFLTDGIPETRSADGRVFGCHRTLDVVWASRRKPAARIVAALYRAARDFGRGTTQLDDMTAVVIKVSPPAA